MSLMSRFTVFILTLMVSAVFSTAFASEPWNLPEGVTPLSHSIYHLHMITFYLCCGIGVIVFGALIYSVVKFRRSRGAQPEEIHEHLGVEILWTAIPFVILIAMAIPATKVLMDIHNTAKPDLDIKVTGYQWKWKYEYLNQGISFFSNLSTPQEQINNLQAKNEWFLLEVDNPLVVPIHKKIRFLFTANDVIHSWWVPDLGFKQDAIPGYINENWTMIEKPGIYRGQCAELCGTYHGFMPIVVKAVTQEEFNQWVQGQQKNATTMASKQSLTKKELLAQGEVAYAKSCAACHQNNGQGLPPTFPALKANAVVIGDVKKQIGVVLHGVSGTPMQAFANQLDDSTLAAIITYTRNAWGNEAINSQHKNAVVVEPHDIKVARDKS